jgi:hypothetical protein
MGLVWSTGTVKDVHRAVELEMKTKASFKLIGERHEYMCIDGVQLDFNELLIYLIKHFGLEEKVHTRGCEIAITVDGAKLDDYCIHVTCGFKITDKDARDSLHIDIDNPLKRGKLLLLTIQRSKNTFPITSIIAKDNKFTYNKFLRHIFEFSQELRDVEIPELGWKPFCVSEPQDMKSSQLCIIVVALRKKFRIFVTCAKITVTTFLVPIKLYVAIVRKFVTRDVVIIIQ